MNFGPVELVFIRFPHNNFRGKILEALANLVRQKTIRIIDILLVRKDDAGKVTIMELNDLNDEEHKGFNLIVADSASILNDEDAKKLSKKMDNNSAAGLMLFEDVWATDLVDAIRDTGGEVVVSERIPRKVVDDVLAKAVATA